VRERTRSTSRHQPAPFAAEQGSGFALIGGLTLDAWGISRATKDADFAVPVGVAEKALEDPRFNLDFNTAFATGPARPHGVAFK